MAKFSEISQEVTENWELYPFLLAVNSEKKYAYVTFGGLARPYDNADNIRGNTFVLCPSRFRMETVSYYRITNDDWLYDYVALQINNSFCNGYSELEIDSAFQENKDEQFRELHNSKDDFKDLFPKEYDGMRKTFDTCFVNIANDNFANLTETTNNIGRLKECFATIIKGVGKYSLEYEDEDRCCLPLFYNIEIAKKHKTDRNAYFNIAYIFLKRLYDFLETKLLKENLQKLEVQELFKLKNKLDNIMSYASHSICYPQWKRLHEHLNKLLLPQTFLYAMYKTVCFAGSKGKDYIEDLPGIAIQPVEDKDYQLIDSDVDFLVKSKEDPFTDEDNWIQVINEDDFVEESLIKKYLEGLKKYSDIFKLSTIKMSEIKEEYKFYDDITKKLSSIDVATTDCIAFDCKYHKNCRYQLGTLLCNNSYKKASAIYKIEKHWQYSNDTFYYNNEALNTLKNLFAVYVLYKSDWYEIAKKNRTFVSKAIRIFCETAMLALYRSGYIPAFYVYEEAVKDKQGKVKYITKQCPYFSNKKNDEERITSSALDMGYAQNYIGELDQTVQASMKSIVRRLDILLQRTNPDMHGAEYFPSKHQLNRMLDYMQDISKEAYQLLDKKKKCLN